MSQKEVSRCEERHFTQRVQERLDTVFIREDEITKMRSDKTPVYSMELERISEALVLCGYTSLDEQAKALGLGRSTTWTIRKNKHKLGRLSAKTTDRILANPQTPPAVRVVVEQYLAKRSDAV